MRTLIKDFKAKDSVTGTKGNVLVYSRSDDKFDYVASFGPEHEASHSGMIVGVDETELDLWLQSKVWNR